MDGRKQEATAAVASFAAHVGAQERNLGGSPGWLAETMRHGKSAMVMGQIGAHGQFW